MAYKFEVRKSNIEGQGVFATQPIKKGELICNMGGEEVSIPELMRRYENGSVRSADPLQVRESHYLILEEPYIYINHSCDPDAVMMKYSDLVAIKDIAIGEEITFDYSLTDWPDYEAWGDYENWSMTCACGSASCRKTILEFPLLPEAIQENAIKRGIVQDYILRKWNK